MIALLDTVGAVQEGLLTVAGIILLALVAHPRGTPWRSLYVGSRYAVKRCIKRLVISRRSTKFEV